MVQAIHRVHTRVQRGSLAWDHLLRPARLIVGKWSVSAGPEQRLAGPGRVGALCGRLEGRYAAPQGLHLSLEAQIETSGPAGDGDGKFQLKDKPDSSI